MKFKKKYFYLLIILFKLTFILSGCATKNYKIKDSLKTIDKTQKKIETTWTQFNVELDRFFASGSFEEEVNKSYIRIKNINELSDGNGLSSGFDLLAQVDFPNTSKDVQFVLQTESDELTSNLNSFDRLISNRSATKQLSTARRERLIENKILNASMDLGFKFTVPLDPFIKIHARRSFKSLRQKLDFIQNLKFYRVEQLEHETIIEYVYNFNKTNSFKNSNSYIYRHIDEGYSFYNSLSLLSKLNSKNAITYSLGSKGISDPVHHYDNYSMSVGLRNKAYKEWFFIEPIIGFNFAKENHFTRRGFIFLIFDAVL